MRRARLWAAAALLCGAACKDPDVAAAEAKQKAAEQQLAEGRVALASGQAEAAVTAFRTASLMMPDNPAPFILLADAERQAGNETAAILALKQADDITKKAGQSATLKHQLADLYRRSGNPAQAIVVLAQLRDSNDLTDEEVLTLARLQAKQGDVKGGFETLNRILIKRPDDPGAKVLEAEILLLKGDELLAAKLMDRLVGEGNLPARALRARYFLNAGFPDNALLDLDAITGELKLSGDVVELRARALNELKRYDEAERALRQLLSADPKNADLLAQLAETKLYQGQPAEAQAMVDQALQIRPYFARALYVRGRALESKGELKQAAENYEYALHSDPTFGPALSRMWQIYVHRGQKVDAMSSLERLFFQNQASTDEKVALAQMYAETRTNIERGRKLVDEALRRDPGNAHYKDVKAALGKAMAGGGGWNRGPQVVILKGRH
ncbi:MAG TPA: tetratricopeptide repeat protein [Myxococcaceae bacterium]|nr:tetratricopeptide repeat protein [Myxococcaceae bacterium]